MVDPPFGYDLAGVEQNPQTSQFLTSSGLRVADQRVLMES